jgi:acyl-coenzyme A synthetase/AMP-(fatty) acid ligase
LKAAKSSGIPNERVYLLEMPKEFSGDKKLPFKTVGQLIAVGEKLPQLEALNWEKGQGAKQTAYLCYSSGTSGLPVRKPHVCGNITSIG